MTTTIGSTRKTNLKSEFLKSAVCFRFFQRKGQKNMNRELSMGKLRLFFLTASVSLIALGSCMRTDAADGRIRLFNDSGSIKREITGSSLFEKPVMPGSNETADLTIQNGLDKSVYYDVRCSSDTANELYDALLLKISDENGTILYNGFAKDTAVSIGPQNSGKTKKLTLELSLPKSADEKIAGKKANFDLQLSFKSDVVSSGESKPSEGADGGSTGNTGSTGGSTGSEGSSGSGGIASGGVTSSGGDFSGEISKPGGNSKPGGHGSSGTGSGGTGNKGYHTGTSSSGAANQDKNIGDSNGVSEEGNIVTGSRFDRNFISGASDSSSETNSAKHDYSISDFFGNHSVSGGGDERTYGKPDITLTKGIDSGSWEQDKEGFWRYVLKGGNHIKSGFAFIKNPYKNNSGEYCWYFFDDEGRLCIGWIKRENDVWYHSHEVSDGDLGAIEAGWIKDSEDKAIYYTSELDAKMHTGWIGFRAKKDQPIDYYYFASLKDTYRQNWFFNTAAGRWLYDKLGYRCYGSMFKDEKTPDGYRVGNDGRWIR